MKRHIRLSAFLFTVVAASAAWAQTATAPLPTAKPEQVGMSGQRLGRLTETFKQEIDQGKLPGAVIMVARKGRLVYAEAFGMQDTGQGDAHVARHHLPHLLDDQAARFHGPDDAGGGRQGRSSPIRSRSSCRRSRAMQVSVAQADSTFAPRELHARPDGARDDGPGPPAPHLRTCVRRDHAERTGEERLCQSRRVQERFRLRSARPSRRRSRSSCSARRRSRTSPAPCGSTASQWTCRVASWRRSSGKRLADFMDERIFKPLKMTDTGVLGAEGEGRATRRAAADRSRIRPAEQADRRVRPAEERFRRRRRRVDRGRLPALLPRQCSTAASSTAPASCRAAPCSS